MLTMNRSRLDRNAAAEVTSRTAPGRAVLMAVPSRMAGPIGPIRRLGPIGSRRIERVVRPGGAAAGQALTRRRARSTAASAAGSRTVVEAVAVGRLQEEPVDEQPQLLDEPVGVRDVEPRDALGDRGAGLGELGARDRTGTAVVTQSVVLGELGQVVAERAPAEPAARDERRDLGDERDELLARVVPRGLEGLLGGAGPALPGSLQIGGHQVGLGREVLVEQVLPGPRLGDDPVHPHRADAVVVEQPRRDTRGCARACPELRSSPSGHLPRRPP